MVHGGELCYNKGTIIFCKRGVNVATAREVALQALSEIISSGTYSKSSISGLIEKNQLSAQDRALMTEIVYGTLRHFHLLEFYSEPYFKGKVKGWFKLLIYLTLYQILYLGQVPQHGAINEAVNIAKKRGGQFTGGVANKILRELCRNPLRPLEEIQDPSQRLATQYSHPLWLVKLWQSQYGEEETVAILKANNERGPLSLRTNTQKMGREQLMEQLLKEGIEVKASHLNPEALIVVKGNPIRTQAFLEGAFYIQDEASMLVAHALAPEADSRVLDVCSAPGGKATHIGALLNGTGKVVAHDLYPQKIKLIEENATRLGLSNIEASVLDATALGGNYPPESFDYLMVDAPCSALGTLRRHPEAKFLKKPQDLDQVLQVSEKILAEASKLLKPGGRLVFSTCTMNRKENEKQVERFLKGHPQFELDPTLSKRMPKPLQDEAKSGMIQLFPSQHKTDGFFIAALVKKV